MITPENLCLWKTHRLFPCERYFLAGQRISFFHKPVLNLTQAAPNHISMKTMRHLLKTAACLIALAAAFLTTSCSRTAAPEPFTAQLENIDGAMLFYSLQHPKLISECIDNLINEIPEASYARIALETYGGQLGYPEFSEIAAGTNIGVVQPSVPPEQLRRGKLAPIVFMKVKEDGKIWNILANMLRMKTKKHGDWTMFAESDAAFDTVKNPDAIIAKLSAPQAENIRIWARIDEENLDAYKALINKTISDAIGKSKLPAEEKNAFNSYAGLLVGEILDSTHNGHASLHLAKDSVRISYGLQFKPDTPIGTFLRYRSEAKPVVGKYIANDALLSATVRYVPQAGKELSDYMTGLLLKVDYKPFSEPLAKLKQDYANYWNQMDGCGAMTMNMNMDFTNPKAPKTEADTFAAYTGKYDRQTMQYMKNSVDLAQKFITQILAIAKQSGAKNTPQMSISTEADAAKIEGSTFDAMVINATSGETSMTQKTYYGVIGGNLITASSEAAIQKRLPALLAKQPLTGNVADATPLQPYDILSMSLNGSALVDMVCKTAKIDLSDPDRQAAFDNIKSAYKKSAPAQVSVEARQADAAYKINIPYKFIAASIKLGQYTYSSAKTSGR